MKPDVLNSFKVGANMFRESISSNFKPKTHSFDNSILPLGIFDLSNNNMKIISKSYANKWIPIPSINAIPQKGKSDFTVKINTKMCPYIIVGITTKSQKALDSNYEKAKNKSFFADNGLFYPGGVMGSRGIVQKVMNREALVKVSLDYNANTLQFEVDGQILTEEEIPTLDEEYYPFISCIEKGIVAEFIEN